MKPEEINILGKVYKIKYCDNPVDVDILKRKPLWGSVDFWTLTIRVYDNNTSIENIWDTIIHETIHVIAEELNLKKLTGEDDESEDTVGLLAMGLADTLFRNGLMKFEKE